MPRRVNLPGADELFRPTAPSANGRTPDLTPRDEPAEPVDPSAGTGASTHRDSGRVKHDEKMTVYVTGEELMAIEQARLRLRRSVGRNVDRGRLVRAAIALALEDLEARGDDSDVARRLGSA